MASISSKTLEKSYSFGQINKKLKNFYNYIGKKIDEYVNYQWMPKSIKLSEEYKKKFRMDDIFYYYDILERPTKVSQRLYLFRDFLMNK